MHSYPLPMKPALHLHLPFTHAAFSSQFAHLSTIQMKNDIDYYHKITTVFCIYRIDYFLRSNLRFSIHVDLERSDFCINQSIDLNHINY